MKLRFGENKFSEEIGCLLGDT